MTRPKKPGCGHPKSLRQIRDDRETDKTIKLYNPGDPGDDPEENHSSNLSKRYFLQTIRNIPIISDLLGTVSSTYDNLTKWELFRRLRQRQLYQ